MQTPSVRPCGYSIPVGGVGVGWADGDGVVGRGLEERDDDKG